MNEGKKIDTFVILECDGIRLVAKMEKPTCNRFSIFLEKESNENAFGEKAWVPKPIEDLSGTNLFLMIGNLGNAVAKKMFESQDFSK